MNLVAAIESVDMDDLIDRMNSYAMSRLKSVGLKDFDGVEPIDFVGEVLLKVVEGKRDWEKAQCSFKEFLFGCLKSDISNFFKTNDHLHEDELPDVPHDVNSTKHHLEQRTQIIEMLKKEGADEDEVNVFEYWMDGVNKPAEIATELDVDVKEIYKITKRLERRLLKVKLTVTDIL